MTEGKGQDKLSPPPPLPRFLPSQPSPTLPTHYHFPSYSGEEGGTDDPGQRIVLGLAGLHGDMDPSSPATTLPPPHPQLGSRDMPAVPFPGETAWNRTVCCGVRRGVFLPSAAARARRPLYAAVAARFIAALLRALFTARQRQRCALFNAYFVYIDTLPCKPWYDGGVSLTSLVIYWSSNA